MGTRTAIAALLLALLVGCGETAEAPSRDAPPARATDAPAPAPPPVEVPQDAPVVVFLGDSLAAGMRLAAHQAFPAVLHRRLAAAGLPFRLVNAGVSGDTTAGGLGRVDWVLKREPAVVVVELGANDGFRGLSPEASEANLRAIVARIRAQGARVLLLGMKMPPNYGAEYTEAFEALYGRIAEDTGVAYVPFFLEGVAGIPAMNLDDGIHPTPEGHERLATNLEPHLTALLRP